MFIKKNGSCWLVSLLLLFTTGVYADETRPASSILTLEAGMDSVDSRETYADLDLGFNNGLHLRGVYGRSWQEYTEDPLVITSRLVGVSSDYGARLVGGFDYEYWGNADVLETRTKRFKLGTNTDNWYFQLSYEIRDTLLYTDEVLTRQSGKLGQQQLPQNYEVGSTGQGVNVSFYGLYPWALSLGYIRYAYDRDIAELETNPRWAEVFSLPTLGLATGLAAWRRSADLSYNFSWGVLGINGAQSESAVDQAITRTTSAYMIWDLDARWSLSLTGGRSETDTISDTITYGRAGLSYRW